MVFISLGEFLDRYCWKIAFSAILGPKRGYFGVLRSYYFYFVVWKWHRSIIIYIRNLCIDNTLKFEEHVSSLCKKANQKLHALARISNYMSSPKLKILMKSFVISQFSYCPLVWMFCSKKMNNRINHTREGPLDCL